MPEAVPGSLSERGDSAPCHSRMRSVRVELFDAQIWAYAEHYGLQEILTEDLQHDRLYGSVRVVNPFLGLS